MNTSKRNSKTQAFIDEMRNGYMYASTMKRDLNEFVRYIKLLNAHQEGVEGASPLRWSTINDIVIDYYINYLEMKADRHTYRLKAIKRKITTLYDFYEWLRYRLNHPELVNPCTQGIARAIRIQNKSQKAA